MHDVGKLDGQSKLNEICDSSFPLHHTSSFIHFFTLENSLACLQFHRLASNKFNSKLHGEEYVTPSEIMIVEEIS